MTAIMHAEQPEALLTPDQVAERLSITRHQVLVLARRGALRKVKISHKDVRFHPDDVRRFVDERRGLGA